MKTENSSIYEDLNKAFSFRSWKVYVIGFTFMICFTGLNFLHLRSQQTVKVSTYTDREVYIDLKTLEPIKSQPATSHVLRVEFLGIEGDNNWVEIIGDVPETFADRFATAEAIAVLKDIVTKEELELYNMRSIQEIGNTTIVKLKK